MRSDSRTPRGFRLPMRKIPWSRDGIGEYPCPVCGKAWSPWVGSLLPCHGRCLLTEELQEALLDEDATLKTQADRRGVTYSVVMSAMRAARRRREKKATCARARRLEEET